MNMIATQTRSLRAARLITLLASLALLVCGNTFADPPAPADDLAQTSSNVSVTISVLTNDVDSSNQLAVLQVTPPSHGTAIINSIVPPCLFHTLSFRR